MSGAASILIYCPTFGHMTGILDLFRALGWKESEWNQMTKPDSGGVVISYGPSLERVGGEDDDRANLGTDRGADSAG